MILDHETYFHSFSLHKNAEIYLPNKIAASYYMASNHNIEEMDTQERAMLTIMCKSNGSLLKEL
jgi:hypothetical protein